MRERETIFAPATGAGAAGVAVVRVSGPAASEAVRALSGRRDLPPARRAVLRRLVDPRNGEMIDRALVLWFPGPDSYTGEDVAEFHIHGGPAVMAGLLEALGGVGGLRLAAPGEFTRRAFEAGRMDLTAAEAVGDLVAAETPAQRRLALRQLDGGLADLYEGWRARLIAALGHAEAEIDFSDEELPDDLHGAVVAAVTEVAGEIAAHLDDARQGERIREGFRIAILGAPNVGKSSLLNQLARRDVAIVSEVAGTTRDVIEVQMNLGGFAVTLADTAGLRETADAIESEGVRRARQAGAEAALRLLVVDAREPAYATNVTRSEGVFVKPTDSDTLVVANKADLVPDDAAGHGTGTWRVSARTGAGIPALLEGLAAEVARRLAGSEAPVLTRARHRAALAECREALARARQAALPELLAEDLRLGARALGRITGRVDIDEVLDVVFRDFCIGK